MTLSKWITPAIALLSLTTGCKNHSDAVKDPTITHTLNAPETSVAGTWCGMFEPTETVNTASAVSPNKITLFIDQMENGEIFGYSVCAGIDRPFKGAYTEEGDKITATLKEPGDNKNDGVFELVITKSPLSLSGKWTPLKPALSSRHYTLVRKNFAYNAAAGKYNESSTRLLTSDDVNNLLKDELRYMRNEIYARHGYTFRLKEVREMFDDQDWYMPISTDVRKKLTAIELKNEKTIKQFEKYANESYDDFGR